MAGRHQLRQGRLHALQVRQAGANVGEAGSGQVGGFPTVGAVVQPKQLGDFVQVETQALGGFDELDPGDVVGTVESDAAKRPLGLGQQSLPLGEPDRLHVDAGLHGQRADGKLFGEHGLDSVLRYGPNLSASRYRAEGLWRANKGKVVEPWRSAVWRLYWPPPVAWGHWCW